MKRSDQVKASRSAILEAADVILRRDGIRAMTLDEVAAAAGCAKGLVHYHFRSKTGLLEQVAVRLATSREAAWVEALRVDDPQAAIDRSWRVLLAETDSGALRAWNTLVSLSEPAVLRVATAASARLRGAIARATEDLMTRAGLESAVPTQDLGWLLTALLDGMGAQLGMGAERRAVENAYLTAWAAVLALTAPVEA